MLPYIEVNNGQASWNMLYKQKYMIYENNSQKTMKLVWTCQEYIKSPPKKLNFQINHNEARMKKI